MRTCTALLLALACAGPLQAQTDTLTILHLNDTHSCLAPLGPRTPALAGTRGGIARAATVIGGTRMTDPNVLLLHAGDLFIGDLFFNSFFGVPELQMLHALGCDAMTVGNHEFDLTPWTLLSALDTAFTGGGFPLLSANMILGDSSVQGLSRHVHPFTVRQTGSLSVGIFGLTTPATNLLSNPAPVFVDTLVLETAAAMVDSLTARGCDVIICLSHLGLGLDLALAAMVPGIDLVIGGHDHYLLEAPQAVPHAGGDTTWVAQANAFYADIGKLTLGVTGAGVRLLGYQMIPLDAGVPEEPSIAGTVQMLVAGIEATYGPVYSSRIGFAAAGFDEVADSLAFPGWKDTPIGNLVADAFRSAAGTDVAIQAGGSTAHPLYPGPLVPADLFRVVGYGFNTDNGLGYRFATFDIAGAALAAGLEIGVSDLSADEFLIQVSGMRYTYDPALPTPGRITGVLVNGVPLDPGRVYSVAANEFVPMFLDAFGIPYTNLHVFADTSEFQVVSAHVGVLDTLYPVREGRVVSGTSVAVEDGVGGPLAFRLEQNYPNPFNPSTTIAWELDVSSAVTVTVYDLLGREVRTLVDGVVAAGPGRVVWDAVDARGIPVPSGVYVYRLRAGDRRQTKKCLLLR